MYICLCKAVTDSDIREAAKNGATTMKDLRNQLEIAIECRQCVHAARKCLKMAQQSNAEQSLKAAA